MLESTVSILQAAEILSVSTKTIRNYIAKSYLAAHIWNGAWRISKSSIVEVYEKKFGKPCIVDSHGHEESEGSVVHIHKQEFAELQQKAGRLETAEMLVDQQRVEIRELNNRIAQTEASAASAWAEARSHKDRADQLAEISTEQQEHEGALKEEISWLRREIDRVNAANIELQADNELLNRKIHVLERQTHLGAIGA